jgi:hypothetical protein
MEAETQTEEEQVNIIEPSDPITPMGIGNLNSCPCRKKDS